MRLRRLTIQNIALFGTETIDFDKLPRGAIAITGKNGVGKSTLLECLGPAFLFREFTSKENSSFAESCRNQDGGSSLVVDFEIGGVDYTSSIKVTKGGTLTATLSCSHFTTSGKVKDYADAMLKLSGPKEAYYACQFAGQGGNHRFSNQTTGERKNIMGHLLGLDRMKSVYDYARVRLVDRGLVNIKDIRDRLEQERARLLDIQQKIPGARKIADAAKSLSDSSTEVADRVAHHVEWWSADADHTAAVAAHRAAVAAFAAFTRGVTAPTVPDAPRDDCDGSRATVSAHRELDPKIATHTLAVQKGSARVSEARTALKELVKKSALLGGVPCKDYPQLQNCGFLSDASKAKEKIATTEALIQEFEKNLAELAEKEALLLAEKAALAPLIEAEAKIASYNAALSDYTRAVAANAALADRTARLEEAIRQHEARVASAKAKLDSLPTPPDGLTQGDIATLRANAVNNRATYEAAAQVVAGLLTDEQRAAMAVANTEQELNRAVAENDAIGPLVLLQRAFGPKGIPAFEIDSAGPTIETIANQILSSCFDGEFRVSLVTQVDAKSTGASKEVLEIMVAQANRTNMVTIGQLSFGQQAMVEECVRIAYSIFGMSRTPRPFRTMLRDEPIGHLTAENTLRYVAALKKAREISDMDQIFFVTHSQEAATAADSHILINDNSKIVLR